ncbi:MAG: lipid-A-disaccharide synthase [Muribaculum sp.]|nr:lipid-A-disaccharide synthase [Muribaculum sp.]
MKYMLIAGETSGDVHASRLIRHIREQDPEARFRFVGGDMMAREARVAPDLHYREMNVMGFSEVIRKFPVIYRNLRNARSILREFRPDVLILVDYPGFNLKMAKYAHRLGIRTEYYISPKLWAWKEWRIRTMRKYVDRILSILPFEKDFFRERGFDKIVYVGNPSVEEIDYNLGHLPPKKHLCERQGISDERPIIALLPGSRKSEIRNNLPLMLEAVRRYPEFQYAVAAAPAIPEKFYREVAQDPGLTVIFDSTVPLLKYSTAALVTSGTATLETSLVGTPQVVCYRANGSKLSYRIMEKLLKIKYVSLPNLIMGRMMIPELLVCYCTPDAISRELSPLLQPSPQRDRQLAGCKALRRKLGTFNAPDFAAELIVSALLPSS